MACHTLSFQLAVAIASRLIQMGIPHVSYITWRESWQIWTPAKEMQLANTTAVGLVFTLSQKFYLQYVLVPLYLRVYSNINEGFVPVELPVRVERLDLH